MGGKKQPNMAIWWRGAGGGRCARTVGGYSHRGRSEKTPSDHSDAKVILSEVLLSKVYDRGSV